jgi:hypothetical protein
VTKRGYIPNVVPFSRTALIKSLKPLASGLLVVLVLFLNALAAAPSLHEIFHADAAQAEHQCGVTLFAHGQIDSAVVEVAAVAPPAPIEIFTLTSVSVFHSTAAILPPGRAPPVSSSNS